MKSRKFWLWVGVLVAAVVTTGVVVDYNITCGWAHRIPWSCMAWTNLKMFRTQFTEDLPRGTLRPAVEGYLRANGIPFAYGTATSEIEEKNLCISKQMPGGWTNSFVGYTYWRISFDRNDRLVQIKTWQEYK